MSQEILVCGMCFDTADFGGKCETPQCNYFLCDECALDWSARCISKAMVPGYCPSCYTIYSWTLKYLKDVCLAIGANFYHRLAVFHQGIQHDEWKKGEFALPEEIKVGRMLWMVKNSKASYDGELSLDGLPLTRPGNGYGWWPENPFMLDYLPTQQCWINPDRLWWHELNYGGVFGTIHEGPDLSSTWWPVWLGNPSRGPPPTKFGKLLKEYSATAGLPPPARDELMKFYPSYSYVNFWCPDSLPCSISW